MFTARYGLELYMQFTIRPRTKFASNLLPFSLLQRITFAIFGPNSALPPLPKYRPKAALQAQNSPAMPNHFPLMLSQQSTSHHFNPFTSSLPCLQPSFIIRTSGSFLGAFRAASLLSPCSNTKRITPHCTHPSRFFPLCLSLVF